MVDSKYKRIYLKSKLPNAWATPPDNVRGNRLMKGHWTAQAYNSQDSLATTAQRIVFHQQALGDTWIAPEFSEDLDQTADQVAPAEEWREASKGYFVLSPGALFRVRCLCLPGGFAQGFNGSMWELSGSVGRVRIGAKFTNGENQTSFKTTTHALPTLSGSWGGAGQDGAAWDYLQRHDLGLYQPDEFEDSLEVQAKYSERTRVEWKVDHFGSPRIVHISGYEQPYAYVMSHLSGVKASMHVHQIDGEALDQPLGSVPQENVKDGATYQEPRFGTRQALDSTKNAIESYGPTIFNWSTFREDTAPVDQTELEPITITSNSFVNVLSQSISSYVEDGPGWKVPLPYCLAYSRNDPGRTLRHRAGDMPVRARIYGWSSGSSSTIRIMGSERSWFDMTIPSGSTASWHEADFFLEGPTGFGGTRRGNIQVFGKAIVGASQLEIEAMQLHWDSEDGSAEAEQIWGSEWLWGTFPWGFIPA